MINFAFYREPKLGFVLPFKVQRLTIIHTESGIPVFVKHWIPQSQKVDDTLYSSMVQGICLVIKESSDQGEIEEIKLSKGILIVKREKTLPIAFVLAVDKTSKILHRSLKTFISLFKENFRDVLSNPSDSQLFDDVAPLIEKCFPFVPTYN